jgi:hypothetical protein
MELEEANSPTPPCPVKRPLPTGGLWPTAGVRERYPKVGLLAASGHGETDGSERCGRFHQFGFQECRVRMTKARLERQSSFAERLTDRARVANFEHRSSFRREDFAMRSLSPPLVVQKRC